MQKLQEQVDEQSSELQTIPTGELYYSVTSVLLCLLGYLCLLAGDLRKSLKPSFQ